MDGNFQQELLSAGQSSPKEAWLLVCCCVRGFFSTTGNSPITCFYFFEWSFGTGWGLPLGDGANVSCVAGVHGVAMEISLLGRVVDELSSGDFTADASLLDNSPEHLLSSDLFPFGCHDTLFKVKLFLLLLGGKFVACTSKSCFDSS